MIKESAETTIRHLF